MSESYFGNGRGLVLGPYHDDEIKAKLLARQRLEQNGNVYHVRARDWADARARIYREAEKQ